MKFYSEVTKTHYDTAEQRKKAEQEYFAEREKAEQEYFAEQEKANAEVEKKSLAERAEKKELAKAVDEACSKLSEAYDNYDVVLKQCREIMAKAQKEVSAKLGAAKDVIADAEQERYKALSNFSNKYGTYSIPISSDKAAKEFRNALRRFDSIWDTFWRNW